MARAKKKDFDKQKLKVGKSKQPASNATSTAFTARAISLPNQAIGKKASLQTYLNLTKHHSVQARKEAVAQLQDIALSSPPSLASICHALGPLILDTEKDVRQQVLKFMKAMPESAFAAHSSLLLLYIQSAMTHITPSIRGESTSFLDVLCVNCPQEVARLGFAKTLSLFFPLLGWPLEGNAQASAVSTALAFGKMADKVKLTHLQSLYKLLELGLADPPVVEEPLFHPETAKFMIPKVSEPFARLGFGTTPENVTEDRDAREIVVHGVKEPLMNGLTVVTKEGGEIGRVAARITALAK
ncbi:Pre-rRNA-processing protein IPI1 [Wickerhamiella sorbophila]|uniref:Pre-rRNA-processing protein n=1 Tax=Wickerhamiella sorbophila TaxID=45607 RepID=A0A2T0FCC4_9ASCO|nr:Pre-rRNA-processing protein IPI1 [Wickerhamiella sorbophila]PRT52615.1 Pre-rRNA-processing protein IPI1 [Wickerhamiella sorbophila]